MPDQPKDAQDVHACLCCATDTVIMLQHCSRTAGDQHVQPMVCRPPVHLDRTNIALGNVIVAHLKLIAAADPGNEACSSAAGTSGDTQRVHAEPVD